MTRMVVMLEFSRVLSLLRPLCYGAKLCACILFLLNLLRRLLSSILPAPFPALLCSSTTGCAHWRSYRASLGCRLLDETFVNCRPLLPRLPLCTRVDSFARWTSLASDQRALVDYKSTGRQLIRSGDRQLRRTPINATSYERKDEDPHYDRA